MRTPSLALSLLPMVLSLFACGGGAAPASAPSSGDAPAAATSTAAAPVSAPPAASDGIDLEKRAEAGFTISLPKGAKEFHRNVTGTLTQLDYTFPLDAQNMRAIEVHVALGVNISETSLDGAVRTATMVGGDVASKKEVAPGTFLVVKKPEGESQHVLFFAPKGTAKCNGPAKYVATLTAICSSLQIR
jgi:hypothetical protein